MLHLRSKFVFAFVLWISASVAPLFAQVPEWIWHDNKGAAPADNEVRYFRKSFTVDEPIIRAILTVACDNSAIVFLNGKQVLSNKAWEKPTTANVTREIKIGENLLAVRGKNEGADAALIAKLEITLANNQKRLIVSDTSWVSSDKETAAWSKPEFQATDWTKPVSLGKLGALPWGDVLTPPTATPAEKLSVPPGFKIELLRSSQPGEGSWVSMTVDPKGRLIISPQDGTGNLLRVTLSPAGSVANLETINQPVGGAMGMLYAFESLYVSGNGPNGLGLYRLRDTDGDDQYDHLELLRKLDGAGGEHGSHGIVLGPDNLLYYVHGNFVKVPKDNSPDSPHKNYAEDLLLPRQNDGNGFGNGLLPPGGFVVRMDRDAKNCELFAAGFRNTYDIAFNSDGELFGFDSDMEWDWGTPWYRPTRINHIVSGGDYGFREGTGKWPIYYPDSLPTMVDIGIGSPTGVKFGDGSNFPEKYKKAFFAMDWSYGRLIVVHLSPKGATYSGGFENFVAPKSLREPGPKTPLNVTDLEFGKDGAMYFTTGGRGTQAGLYRVSFVGPASSTHERGLAQADLQAAAEARALRHKLEAFHGRKNPGAIDFVWPHLNSPDRWIRYAARIAIESQDVDTWQSRALEETHTDASLTALLALARKGSASAQKELLESLSHRVPDEMSESQKLDSLRVLGLAFVRLGRPDLETANDVIEALAKLYPMHIDKLDRELCQLLIYLEAPEVAGKTLDLVDAAPTQEEQIHYLIHLRNLKTGWTMEQRRHYFSWFLRGRDGLKHPPELMQWFQDVGSDYRDGASFPKFIANLRKAALATLNDNERAEIALLLAGQVVTPKPPAVQRQLVKEWKTSDLLPALEQASRGRSFQQGQQAFNDAQCIACHRFGNEGGSVGPDLTAISSRFTRRDILDSILEPSKVVSEQYQNMTIVKKNGDDVTGRVVEEDDTKVVLITDALKQDRAEIRKSDIQSRAASKLSPMAEGLVNILTKDEILDLVAYLESSGKPNAAAFKP